MSAPVLTGCSLIDGSWRPGVGTFDAQDPRDGRALGPVFHQAGAEDVDRAATAACGAAAAIAVIAKDEPRWPARLLRAIAARLEGEAETLIERTLKETALSQARLVGELDRTCRQLRRFAEVVDDGAWVDAVIDTADPARRPLPRPGIRRMLRALGPVAVFDAGNFPLAFGPCGGDTASALAAGNPVIVKAHPGHPGCDELCAAAVAAALVDERLPLGLFALLQGPDESVARALVQHPAVQAVGFTGSHRAGRALADVAASRPVPIPVFAEMGSLNPLVVMPGALAERGDAIADGLANAITAHGGQLCTKPGAILVPTGAVGDRFVARLCERIGAAAPTVLLSRRGADAFDRATADLSARATRLIGGTGMPSLFTVDIASWRDDPLLRAEAFGPAAIVVRWAERSALVAALAALDGQLTGTLHRGAADHPEEVAPVLEALQERSGRVIVDGYPTGVEVGRAMVHGGPYPASSAPASTSVGTAAILRFVRPLAFQDVPDGLLPLALRDGNPLGILRLVDGVPTRQPIAAGIGTGTATAAGAGA